MSELVGSIFDSRWLVSLKRKNRCVWLVLGIRCCRSGMMVVIRETLSSPILIPLIDRDLFLSVLSAGRRLEPNFGLPFFFHFPELSQVDILISVQMRKWEFRRIIFLVAGPLLNTGPER